MALRQTELMARALAVDDETVSRLVISRMLHALGFEVVEASDVPDAIEQLEAQRFDLIVSDYNMPAGTGYDLARYVADRCPTPFILLTGFSHQSDLEDDLGTVVDAHLTKPVSSADLAQAVDAADRSRLEAPRTAPPDDSGDSTAVAMALLDAVGVEVTLIDSQARVMHSTAAARRTLGYDEQFWSERSLFDLAHPDDLGSAQKSLADILNRPGESERTRFRARHSLGHWEVVEVQCTNHLTDPRIGALVVTRAVTDEEQSKTAHDEVTQSRSAQAEYVASVSHELRSPLQGILGVAQLLEGQLSGDPADLVSIIRTEAERLRRVIDDILDYTKVGSGAMELAPEPTSVRRIASNVANIVSSQLKPSVTLLVEIDDLVAPWVLVDGLRLHQVLLNLVANAARHTQTGTVTVSCRCVEGERLYFAVTDTGTGIEPDLIDKLFEPFQQGAQADNNVGTGLGLAISHNLIGLMGGRFDVDSELGAGSTFSFAIRAVPVDAPEIVGARSSQMLTPERVATALVMDDGEINRLVIGRQLELLGFQVETAEDGQTGAAMAIAGGYDILIADWHMPGVDGLEAIRRIRAHEAGSGRHTPIISMTASAMAGDQEKCLAAGADGFLAKPATHFELQEAIERYTNVIPAGRPNESSSGPTDHVDPETSSTAAVVVDTTVLDELATQLGDKATVISVVSTFLGDLQMRAEAIATAIVAGDKPAATQAAHTLKSPSLMLGAMGLGTFCQLIEGTGPPATRDELDDLIRTTALELQLWQSQQQETAT